MKRWQVSLPSRRETRKNTILQPYPFVFLRTSGRCGPRSVIAGEIFLLRLFQRVEIKNFIEMGQNTPYVFM